jgi:hypothetical protein
MMTQRLTVLVIMLALRIYIPIPLSHTFALQLHLESGCHFVMKLLLRIVTPYSLIMVLLEVLLIDTVNSLLNFWQVIMTKFDNTVVLSE